MTPVRPLFAAAALLAGISPEAFAQRVDRAARFIETESPDAFRSAVPVGAQQVTVVLKLAGDPVAVVRSRAPGKEIRDDEKEAIEHDLRQQQDALHALIEANGGTVIAKFQDAINGIKVEAPAEKLAALSLLPGVVALKPVAVHELDNAASVPFIGAPEVWGGSPGFRGEHIKIAIVDTGIDYTHANFAGPGTVDAFKAAAKTSTLPADPKLFGLDAPKVKGGIDLVGDDYNASAPPVGGKPNPRRTPHPDPNPLDCNGHGSHVAGTAAGFGVTAKGGTFTGSYDANTPKGSFRIGPGVAPLADLYAVRVFGCTGSTNVVVEALDWAVKHGMQVVNMSLGAPFGAADTADAEASNNAVDAGIVVVASAGNSGPNPYITGSPASADKAISVAAVDSTPSFAGANVGLSTGKTIQVTNSNGAPFTDGTFLPVVVLRTATGAISLGCNPAQYTAAGVAGKLVVMRRGTCARVARAIFAEKAGAKAAIMVNNDPSDLFPPFEGQITQNPDDGEKFTVTIPFFGARLSSGGALLAANSGTAKLTNNPKVDNPGFRRFATFSSGGPRIGDATLKPDISAPGVSVISTLIGTGNGSAAFSGTSMAAPHVSGVAALALQSHPGWDSEDVRTAIVNTAVAAKLDLATFTARVGGNGLVQPTGATRTSVIAQGSAGASGLSFGVRQFSEDFNANAAIDVRNLGTKTATFTASAVPGAGSPHTVSVRPTTLSVAPGRRAKLHVQLRIPAGKVGDASAFRDVAGTVALLPTGATASTGAPLAVPYYVVTRARAEIQAELEGDLGPARPTATVQLENESEAVAGNADFYALGLTGKNRKAGSVGLRAVGVQAFGSGAGRLLVFAVNTFAPWSTAATKEFDILIDVDGDGKPDFIVFAADLNGDGSVLSGVFDVTNGITTVRFGAFAPTDGSTIELPVFVRDLSSPKANPNVKPPILDACSGGKHCAVTESTPRFTYAGQSFDFDNDNTDAILDANGRFVTAPFNAFHSSISTGDFADVSAGGRAAVAVTIDPVEFKLTPALGQMVVSVDNFSGTKQAALLRIGGEKDDD